MDYKKKRPAISLRCSFENEGHGRIPSGSDSSIRVRVGATGRRRRAHRNVVYCVDEGAVVARFHLVGVASEWHGREQSRGRDNGSGAST